MWRSKQFSVQTEAERSWDREEANGSNGSRSSQSHEEAETLRSQNLQALEWRMKMPTDSWKRKLDPERDLKAQ